MKKVFLAGMLLASIASCTKDQQQDIKDTIIPPKPFVVPGVCPELSVAPLQVYPEFEHTVFNTGWGSEQSSCIVAPHKLPDAEQTPLYFAQLNDIGVGDTLISSFTAEVTCEIPVGSFIQWHVEIVRVSDGKVVYSTPAHGTNVSLEEHHFTFGETLHYKFVESGTYMVQVWAIAAIGNFEYQVENSHLVVENHYGNLGGTLFKGPLIMNEELK